MKRLIAFLICFAVSLSVLTGCGGAAAKQTAGSAGEPETAALDVSISDTPSLAEGSHDAEASPFVRGSWFPEGSTQNSAAEVSADLATAVTAYELAQVMDEKIGCFYVNKDRLEAIRALPQADEQVFLLTPLPGFEYDERYAGVLEALRANKRAAEIYKAVTEGDPPEGDPPEGDYGDIDPDDYPMAKNSWFRDDFDRLPREWFELYETAQEVMRDTETVRRLTNVLIPEYDIAAAKVLAEAGADVQVRSRELNGTQGAEAYVLFIRAAPDELWKLSESVQGIYKLDLYDGTYGDICGEYDTAVWPGA